MSLSNRSTHPTSPEERTFTERIGQRIRELRKARDLTQVELAARIGYSQQHIVSFEKGRRKVPAAACPRSLKPSASPSRSCSARQPSPPSEGQHPSSLSSSSSSADYHALNSASSLR